MKKVRQNRFLAGVVCIVVMMISAPLAIKQWNEQRSYFAIQEDIPEYQVKTWDKEYLTTFRTGEDKKQIDVYQDKESFQIILNTRSDSPVDRAQQYLLEVTQPVTADDVQVEWEGMMSEPLEADSEHIALAKITVQKDGQVLAEQTVSFIEKMGKVFEIAFDPEARRQAQFEANWNVPLFICIGAAIGYVILLTLQIRDNIQLRRKQKEIQQAKESNDSLDSNNQE